MIFPTSTYTKRQNEMPKVTFVSSSFPGLILLAIGIFIFVCGAVLMACLHLPKVPIGDNIETIAGPIVLCVGLLFNGTGIGVLLYLKKKREKTRAKPRVSPNWASTNDQLA